VISALLSLFTPKWQRQPTKSELQLLAAPPTKPQVFCPTNQTKRLAKAIVLKSVLAAEAKKGGVGTCSDTRPRLKRLPLEANVGNSAHLAARFKQEAEIQIANHARKGNQTACPSSP
jgi:hypothetical protein